MLDEDEIVVTNVWIIEHSNRVVFESISLSKRVVAKHIASAWFHTIVFKRNGVVEAHNPDFPVCFSIFQSMSRRNNDNVMHISDG